MVKGCREIIAENEPEAVDIKEREEGPRGSGEVSTRKDPIGRIGHYERARFFQRIWGKKKEKSRARRTRK